mmetsp:Transcript_11017/g.24658  ORF Transcript_11017/g.24658 Transcript_11017/m.24658 type:complete len:392 (-) Transcript_11017:1771-2946(-)
MYECLLVVSPTAKGSGQSALQILIILRHWFVFNPLSIVPNGTVRKRFDALSVRHSIQPFALVATPILPIADPISIVSSVLPTTFVSATVGKFVRSVAFPLPIAKVTIVHSTIGPSKDTPAMALVLSEHSIVNTTVIPFISSTTMSLVKTIFTMIIVSIGKCGTTIAMPSAMTPFAVVGSFVFLVNHATRTVRHSCGAQNDARVGTLVTVRVQNTLLYHLLSVFSIGGGGYSVSQTHIVGIGEIDQNGRGYAVLVTVGGGSLVGPVCLSFGTAATIEAFYRGFFLGRWQSWDALAGNAASIAGSGRRRINTDIAWHIGIRKTFSTTAFPRGSSSSSSSLWWIDRRRRCNFLSCLGLFDHVRNIIQVDGATAGSTGHLGGLLLVVRTSRRQRQ